MLNEKVEPVSVPDTVEGRRARAKELMNELVELIIR